MLESLVDQKKVSISRIFHSISKPIRKQLPLPVDIFDKGSGYDFFVVVDDQTSFLSTPRALSLVSPSRFSQMLPLLFS